MADFILLRKNDDGTLQEVVSCPALNATSLFIRADGYEPLFDGPLPAAPAVGGSPQPGPVGPSAYDVACTNGFVGTQVQWLASLKGEPGTNGTGGTPTIPDFTASLLAAFAAGEFFDWPHGDVVLPAPVVVPCVANVSGVGFDLHGAHVTPGFTDTTKRLITFVAPTTNPQNTNIRAINIRNATINGQGKVLSGLAFICNPSSTGIYSGVVSQVEVYNCTGPGLFIEGDVFELGFEDCVGSDNGTDGLEINNATAGNGIGVISSIWVHGGDYRTNGRYGIGITATTTYQEAHGVDIEQVDFIANGSAAIGAGAGCTVKDCHMESNNNDPAKWSTTQGAIFVWGGWVVLDTIDCANAGGTKYLLDIASPGQQSSMARCGVVNENGGSGVKLMRLNGAGKMIVDRVMTAADYDSNGQWSIVEPVTTTRSI